MKINVLHIDDERYIRNIELIIGLFFEEPAVLFHTDEETEQTIRFSMNTTEETYTVRATLETKTETYEATRTISITEENEREQMKKNKQALSFVLLSVLQEWTGMEQPWGILTGVRPTKLYHTFLKKGKTEAEIHRILQEDYLIKPHKIELLQKIVKNQHRVIPDLYHLEKEVSVYIGIPFCPTKCAYCTFPAYAIGTQQNNVGGFLEGLHYELEQTGAFFRENDIKITTVYFGGGTPTSITAEEMDALYEKMYDVFPHAEQIREVTVEAGRPDTITVDKLNVLKKWGIDRISINPQSYTESTLKAIGRHHTVTETIEKYKLAREMGMNNINMDLIIGLPGEGMKEFTNSLEQTEELQPESLTVHTLSFKRASEMTKNKAKYPVASREEVTNMMELAEVWTNQHDYTPYYLYRQKNILGNLENVGYSKVGQESLYNILIMEEEQSIIGLGCGAASKFVCPKTRKITHFANPKDPKSYNESYKEYTHKKIEQLRNLF